MEVDSQFLFNLSIKYKISKFGHLATYNGQLGWVTARVTKNRMDVIKPIQQITKFQL